MKANKEWHLTLPMPKNPTLEQRISWHLEHAIQFTCRAIPEKLKEEMERKKLST